MDNMEFSQHQRIARASYGSNSRNSRAHHPLSKNKSFFGTGKNRSKLSHRGLPKVMPMDIMACRQSFPASTHSQGKLCQ
jgi:hypothetical protein